MSRRHRSNISQVACGITKIQWTRVGSNEKVGEKRSHRHNLVDRTFGKVGEAAESLNGRHLRCNTRTMTSFSRAAIFEIPLSRADGVGVPIQISYLELAAANWQ